MVCLRNICINTLHKGDNDDDDDDDNNINNNSSKILVVVVVLRTNVLKSNYLKYYVKNGNMFRHIGHQRASNY